MRRCAVLIYDRKQTNEKGRVMFRSCGAVANATVIMRGDYLFSVCWRHNGRLERAGVKINGAG